MLFILFLSLSYSKLVENSYENEMVQIIDSFLVVKINK